MQSTNCPCRVLYALIVTRMERHCHTVTLLHALFHSARYGRRMTTRLFQIKQDAGLVIIITYYYLYSYESLADSATDTENLRKKGGE